MVSGTTTETHEALVARAVSGAGQELDPALRSTFESRFGHDFSHVRIHTESNAAHSALALDADAYTVGSNIVFAPGRYCPETRVGHRLLSHELAHVIQQAGTSSGAGFAEDARLEADAEVAAQHVTDCGTARVRANAAPAGLMRQKKGGSQPAPPKLVEPRALTDDEHKIVEAARRAAFVRTFQARDRIVGLGPPPPRGEPDVGGYEHQQRAYQLATRMFDWNPPNMDQVHEIVGSMLTGVSPGTDFRAAKAGDPECGMRAGYVRDHHLPVVLCPQFFKVNAEQRIRTLIHESAHLAGIGKGDKGESYCIVFDCAHGCGGFDSADSWAQFVHCLSGQPADKPQVIKGKAPAAKKGSKP